MPKCWSDLDSDEHRLPEGFRRVGHDANERRYYFRDQDGQTWWSEPGNEYGVLTPVTSEPPVTIPRRPFPPPPCSKEPIEDPPTTKFTSAFKTFQKILSPRQTASATPRRSYTINIPSVTLFKRSSTIAAPFLRSRGRHSTKSEHSKEQAHENDTQQPPHTIHHRRAVSSPVTIRRSATTTAYSKGEMKSSVKPVETLNRHRKREASASEQNS